MEIDPGVLAQRDRYKLLIGGILPRPIALVSTLDAQGRANLAPFSFFTGVSSEPMSLLFCPANKPDGAEKDTLRNILSASDADGAGAECVVNVVSRAFAPRMAACAEELPAGESEFDLSGLTPVTSRVVRPARVRESPLSYECRTIRVIRLAPPGTPGGGNIVICRVVHVHADDSSIDPRLHLDPAVLDLVGRLGGLGYCTTRDRFELPMGRDALSS